MKGGGGFFRPSLVSTRETFQAAPATSVADPLRGLAVGQPRVRAVELQLLPVEGEEARRERRRSGRLELRVHGPVLDRVERLDLPLPLADDPESHRLDASGREPPPDLLPEEVGDLVADEPVDDPPRLLRVDQARVDLPRILHGPQDGLLRDLVESDSLEDGVLSRGAVGPRAGARRSPRPRGPGRRPGRHGLGRRARLSSSRRASSPCRARPRRSARTRCRGPLPVPSAAGRGRGRTTRGRDSPCRETSRESSLWREIRR